MLGTWPNGRHVLDLFAGTGAMGLEAISRGSRSAVFVDRAADAVKVIRRNAQHCDVVDACRFVRWDITRNLNCLLPLNLKFGLVFIDPPYRRDLVAPSLKHLHSTDMLTDDALVVVEHHSREHLAFSPDRYSLVNDKTYGQTQVAILCRTGDRVET